MARRVLYAARAGGDRVVVACFDRDHGRAEVVFAPPCGTPALAWNGDEPLVLWQHSRSRPMQLTALDLERRAPLRSWSIARVLRVARRRGRPPRDRGRGHRSRGALTLRAACGRKTKQR